MKYFYSFLFIFVLLAAAVGFLFLLIKRRDLVIKYWKWGLGILGSFLALIGLGFLTSKEKESEVSRDPHLLKKERELEESLGMSRKDLEEKIEVLKEEEEQVHSEIEEISKIEDEQERLQRLADLWNARRGR
tara:strand:+ start:2117 stop:2512 length:396 start_codon:yes stop_codon:yes gene_type:complete